MRKSISVIAAAVFAAGVLTACANGKTETTSAATQPATTVESKAETDTKVTAAEAGKETAATGTGELKKFVVGASPAPHAQILEAAKPIMAEMGYDLEIMEYTDYVQPNLALESGDLDANYFQHFPYLEDFNANKGTKLNSAAAIHYEPFGIYAGKTSSLDALKDGAKVAVPNDVSNEARALLLLEAQGLIQLKEGAGLQATVKDIETYNKKLDIVEIEAAQIPRSLGDVDIAVVNGNYAIAAGLKVKDAIATEDSQSLAATTYGNIVAVREGDENNEGVLALIDALTSDTVKQYIEKTYEGAVVPLF